MKSEFGSLSAPRQGIGMRFLDADGPAANILANVLDKMQDTSSRAAELRRELVRRQRQKALARLPTGFEVPDKIVLAASVAAASARSAASSTAVSSYARGSSFRGTSPSPSHRAAQHSQRSQRSRSPTSQRSHHLQSPFSQFSHSPFSQRSSFSSRQRSSRLSHRSQSSSHRSGSSTSYRAPSGRRLSIFSRRRGGISASAAAPEEENCSPAGYVGIACQIISLTDRPECTDAIGSILSYDVPTGRVAVRLSRARQVIGAQPLDASDEVLRVRSCNLRVRSIGSEGVPVPRRPATAMPATNANERPDAVSGPSLIAASNRLLAGLAPHALPSKLDDSDAVWDPPPKSTLSKGSPPRMLRELTSTGRCSTPWSQHM